MRGTWTTLEIAGKLADVYELEGGARPRFGLIFLHGIGLETLSDNAAFTVLFDELRLGCVSPHGGRSWWVDRVCPEFDPVRTAERHVVEQVAPWARQHWGLGTRELGLLGISMGGQAALRLGFKYPDDFPAIAGISPAIEYHLLYGQGTPLDDMYDSKEQCRQDTAILHVHPTRQPPHIFFCIDPDDDWHRGNDRLHEKLSALGVAHQCDLSTRAGGHSWAYFNSQASRAVRFLASALEQESRRLL